MLRDTDMQRDTIGAPIPAAAESDLRRNDLLYMPGHVLIYEGEGSVIHADGASMTVRREPLAGFMRPRGLASPRLSCAAPDRIIARQLRSQPSRGDRPCSRP